MISTLEKVVEVGKTIVDVAVLPNDSSIIYFDQTTVTTSPPTYMYLPKILFLQIYAKHCTIAIARFMILFASISYFFCTNNIKIKYMANIWYSIFAIVLHLTFST